jgi:hypothetical protein
MQYYIANVTQSFADFTLSGVGSGRSFAAWVVEL